MFMGYVHGGDAGNLRVSACLILFRFLNCQPGTPWSSLSLSTGTFAIPSISPAKLFARLSPSNFRLDRSVHGIFEKIHVRYALSWMPRTTPRKRIRTISLALVLLQEALVKNVVWLLTSMLYFSNYFETSSLMNSYTGALSSRTVVLGDFSTEK